MLNRSWHFAPILGGISAGFILHFLDSGIFFADRFRTFETIGALAGLIGLASTLIEVIRTGSISAALAVNLQAFSQRKRGGDIARLIHEARDAITILESGRLISALTASDLTGRLMALFPNDQPIGKRSFASYEGTLRKLSFVSNKKDRQEAIDALSEIRVGLEAEQSLILSSYDKLIVGGGN